MFDTVFGDDFKKHMMDGVEEHWDRLAGKGKKKMMV